jgi:uncharacterized protein
MRAAMATLCGAVIALGAAMLPAAAADEPAIPPAGSRLTDLAKALTPAERAKLIAKLEEIETKTGAQVAVLVVASTQPLGIEQYAIRVFDAWKLGKAGIDNGLLVLVATADKKTRIEVGRGLEGVIPDAWARRIIENDMVRPFSKGQYGAGLMAGLESLQERIVEDQPARLPVAKPAPGLRDYIAGFGLGSEMTSLLVLLATFLLVAFGPRFDPNSGMLSLLVMIAVTGGVVLLARFFGWKTRSSATGIASDTNDSSSFTGGGGSGSYGDSNALGSGGGESAGGGASASFGDSSSDSGSSDSGSSDSGSSDSGSSDSGSSDSSN